MLVRDALAEVQAAIADLSEVASEHELHRHVVRAGFLADLVELDDVLVLQAGGDARLLHQHGDQIFLVDEIGADRFHHARALVSARTDLLREINVGHAADREALDQPVPADPTLIDRGLAHQSTA